MYAAQQEENNRNADGEEFQRERDEEEDFLASPSLSFLQVETRLSLRFLPFLLSSFSFVFVVVCLVEGKSSLLFCLRKLRESVRKRKSLFRSPRVWRSLSMCMHGCKEEVGACP